MLAIVVIIILKRQIFSFLFGVTVQGETLQRFLNFWSLFPQDDAFSELDCCFHKGWDSGLTTLNVYSAPWYTCQGNDTFSPDFS